MALFESKEKKLKKQQEEEEARVNAEYEAKFAAKQERKKVEKTIDEIDKAWYIKMAENYVKDFLGKSRKIKRTNTRKINTHKRNILKFLEE